MNSRYGRGRSWQVAVIGAIVLLSGFTALARPGPAGGAARQWSMYGHDSAHTGRSAADGPATAHLLWKLNLPAHAQDNASPVVGPDGTIYMPSEQGLFAVNPDGTLKWQKWTNGLGSTFIRSAPAVAPDGTVYVWKANFLSGGRLYALSPTNGNVLWSYFTGGATYGSPTIGPDGTIYIGSAADGSNLRANNVYAIKPDGTLKWVWHSHSTCWFETSPALGPDGTVYIQHNCLGLIALRRNGTLKWIISGYGGLGQAWDSPSVGPDGTIYIGNSDFYFYAIKPDGKLKWRVPVRQWMYLSSSAISARGTAIYRGDNDGNFYAFSSSGHIRWRFRPADHGPIFSAPVLSANGIVYFTQEVTKKKDASLYALRASTGKLVWKYPVGPADGSPALAANGTLYVAVANPARSGKETLYAFR